VAAREGEAAKHRAQDNDVPQNHQLALKPLSSLDRTTRGRDSELCITGKLTYPSAAGPSKKRLKILSFYDRKGLELEDAGMIWAAVQTPACTT
jgi:hypothetical protein